MNRHEYQRTHNLHKIIYEKFDYIILQIIKTSWTNINTPKKNHHKFEKIISQFVKT